MDSQFSCCYRVCFRLFTARGTGLLIRSFLRVLDVDLGFQPERLATIRIDPSSENSTPAKRNVYFNEALRLVQNTPGIEASGLTDVLPLEGDRSWGVRRGRPGVRKRKLP